MNYTQIAELALMKHYRKENEELKNKLLAMRCEIARIEDDIKIKWWSHEIPKELIQRLRKLAE